MHYSLIFCFLYLLTKRISTNDEYNITTTCYLGENICSGNFSECDGTTREKAFKNLAQSWAFLFRINSSVTLKIITEKITLTKEHFIELNVKIDPMEPIKVWNAKDNERKQITMEPGDNIEFVELSIKYVPIIIIVPGSWTIRRVGFSSDFNISSVFFPPKSLIYKNSWAFFTFPKDRNASLLLDSCTFTNLFQPFPDYSNITSFFNIQNIQLNKLTIINSNFTDIFIPEAFIKDNSDWAPMTSRQLITLYGLRIHRVNNNPNFIKAMNNQTSLKLNIVFQLDNSSLLLDKVSIEDCMVQIARSVKSNITLQHSNFKNSGIPRFQLINVLNDNQIFLRNLSSRNMYQFADKLVVFPNEFYDVEKLAPYSYISFYEGNTVILQGVIFESVFYDQVSNDKEVTFINFYRNNTVLFEGCIFHNITAMSGNDFSILKFYTENKATFTNSSIQLINLKTYINLEYLRNKESDLLFSFNPIYNQSLVDDTLISLSCIVLNIGNTLIMESVNASNLVGNTGGLAFIEYKNLVIVKNLRAENIVSDIVGGLFAIWLNNTVHLSEINAQNMYSLKGGLIFSGTLNIIKITGSAFINVQVTNTVSNDFMNSSSSLIDMFISNTLYYVNNTAEKGFAQNYGGAFSADIYNKVFIIDSRFFSFGTFFWGGFLFLRTKNFCFLKNISIIKIDSKYGGVAFMEQFNFILGEDLRISDSYAEEGGAFQISINNSLYLFGFNGNSKSRLLGGMFCLNLSSLIFLQDAIIDNCDSGSGGVLSANSQNKIFLSRIRINNTYAKLGGVFYFLSFNELSIETTTSRNSSVFLNAGWLYCEENNKIEINNVNLSDSSAKISAGSIYLYKSNNLKAKNLNIINSKAIKYGGFLYSLEKNIIMLEGAVFKLNYGVYYGALIFSEKKSTIILKSVYSDYNFPVYGGGLIHVENYNTVNMDACQIKQSINTLGGEIIMNAIQGNSIFISNSSIVIKLNEGYMNNSCTFFNLVKDNRLVLMNKTNLFSYKVKSELLNYSYPMFKSNDSNIIFLDQVTVTMKSNLLSLVISKNNDTITIRNSYFTGNICPYFLSILSNCSLKIITSFFLDNSFSKAFLYAEASTVVIARSQFKESNSEVNQMIIGRNVSLILNRVKISFCQKMKRSGIMNSKFFIQRSSRLDIIHSEIICTETNVYSGPIYCEDSYKVNIINSSFLNSKVWSGFGGFITIVSTNYVRIINNKFMMSVARGGGVLAAFNLTSFNFSRNEIFKSSAINSEIKTPSANSLYNSTIFLNFIMTLSDSSSQSAGGCFYFDNIADYKKLYFENNKFLHIESDIGGIFFTKNFEFDKEHQENFMAKNKVILDHILVTKYGELLASSIKTIVVLKNLSEIDLVFHTQKKQLYEVKLNTSILSGSVSDDCFFVFIPQDGYSNPALWEESVLNVTNQTFFPSLLNSEQQEIVISFIEKQGFLCAYSITDKRKTPFSKTLSILLDVSKFMNGNLNVTVDLKVEFRNCTLGEMFDEKENQCTPCVSGFFSFNDNFSSPSTCYRCSNTPFYCYGGQNLTPKAGYWRVDEKSPNFLKCPNRLACLGDIGGELDSANGYYENKLPKGQCARGYTGILCSECDEGFGRSDEYKCGDCNQRWYYIRALSKLFIKLLIFAYSLRKAMNLTQNLKDLKFQESEGSTPYSLAATNSVIKIILNHTHILYTLFMFPYDWPIQFEEMIASTFGLISPGISNSLSFECILLNMDLKIEYLYFQLLCLILFPIFVALLYILTSFILIYIRKRKRLWSKILSTNADQRRGGFIISRLSMTEANIIKKIVFSIKKKISIEAVLLLVFMLSSVDISHAVGYTFFHVNVGYGNKKSKRVLWQPKIEFDSPSHNLWVYIVSVPATVIFGLFFPAYIMIRLWPLRKINRNRRIGSFDESDGSSSYNKIMKKEQAKSEFFFRYGYFYYPYKPTRFYYELIYILRRDIFILFDIFIIPLLRIQNKYNPITFIILATIVLWCFFLLHLYMNPYREEINTINKLENFSYIALLSSYYFASLLLVDYKEESALGFYMEDKKESPIWLSGSMFVLTMSTNISFLIFTGRLFFFYEWKNIRASLLQMLTALKYRLSIFWSNIKGERPSVKAKLNVDLTESVRSNSNKLSRKNPILEWEIKKEKYEKEITHLKEDNILVKIALKERQDEATNLESVLRKKNTLLRLLRKENKILRDQILSDFNFTHNLVLNFFLKGSSAKMDSAKETFFQTSETPLPLTLMGKDFAKLSKFEKFDSKNDEEGKINLIHRSGLLNNTNFQSKPPDDKNLQEELAEAELEKGGLEIFLNISQKKSLIQIENLQFYLRLDITISNTGERTFDLLKIKDPIYQVHDNLIIKKDENFKKMVGKQSKLPPGETQIFSLFFRLLDFTKPHDSSLVFEVEGRVLQKIFRKLEIVTINFSEFIAFGDLKKKNMISESMNLLRKNKNSQNKKEQVNFLVVQLEKMRLETNHNEIDAKTEEKDTLLWEFSKTTEKEAESIKTLIQEHYPKIILTPQEAKDKDLGESDVESSGRHFSNPINSGLRTVQESVFSGKCLMMILFLGQSLKLSLNIAKSKITFEILGNEKAKLKINKNFKGSEELKLFLQILILKKFDFLFQEQGGS